MNNAYHSRHFRSSKSINKMDKLLIFPVRVMDKLLIFTVRWNIIYVSLLCLWQYFFSDFFLIFIKCFLYLVLQRMYPHYNRLISNCFAASVIVFSIFARLFDSPNSVLTNVSWQNVKHVTRFSSKPLAVRPLLASGEYYKLNTVFFPCCYIHCTSREQISL